MSQQRLQKVIAAAGITSRRKAEALILAGRVSVNGEAVRELGITADPGRDRIEVDGAPLPSPERIYIALHKPVGVTSSVADPHADRVVVDLLGPEIDQRVYPVGRLDLESEGLMLLTNDGPLMHAVTRPGGRVEKVYEVEVSGEPSEGDLERLRAGIRLDDGRRLRRCTIERLGGDGGDAEPPRTRLRIVLHEGKRRQIRRMFRNVGHRVTRLVRVRIGPVELAGLQAGDYRHLRDDEVAALRRQATAEPPS